MVAVSGPFCQGPRNKAVSQTSVPLARFLLCLVATDGCCDPPFTWAEPACSHVYIFLVGSVPWAACLGPGGSRSPPQEICTGLAAPWEEGPWGSGPAWGSRYAPALSALRSWVGAGSHWPQWNQDRAPETGEGRGTACGPSSEAKA